MLGFKVDKKMVLTGLAALFGAGAFVVDMLTKKEATNETAQEAAKIVMDMLSDKR